MTQSQPVLSYGPPARGRARWAVVLLGGVVTTALTLALSWGVERATEGRFSPMGLYLAFVVPAGAMLLGAGAASGYALAVLWTGVRVRGRLLLAVLGITVLSYFAMHYVEFLGLGPMVHKGTGAPFTFAEYFDLKTRSMRFRVGTAGSLDRDTGALDLGAFGYAVRVLELGAFALGAVAAPLHVQGRRYCDLCERYHRVTRLAVVPASMPTKKPIGQSPPDVEAAHAAVCRDADAIVNRLADAICDDDPAAFGQYVARLAPGTKAAAKLVRRVEVRLTQCPGCGQGVVAPTLVTVVTAQNVKRQELWSTAITPAFADALRPR